jgi:hypothetical protein
MNMYRLESSQGEVYYVVAPNWTAAWDVIQQYYPAANIIVARNESRGSKVVVA